MNKIVLSLLFAISLNNTANANVVNEELTGFKNIKFSMTALDLEKIGASCVGSAYCTLYNESIKGMTFLGQPVLSPSKKQNDTLFPTPEFTIFLSDESPNQVSEIHVYINMSGANVSETLGSRLGKPIRWGYWDHWFFKNGAMISTYNPPEQFYPAKTLYRPTKQAAKHYSRIMPKSLLPALNINDF